ncbi:MAG: Na/Pi cotransporter family protein [Minisyncoccota bacterium]
MTILSAFVTVLALVFIMLNAVSKFSKHIEIVAGDKFKNIIQSLTSNPIRGTMVGTLFTGLIQSSAATMLMAVSLVDSGVMSFYSSLGVMFGANIGTTLTSQLVSLNFTSIAPYIVILGFLINAYDWKYKKYGKPILYFGIVFLSLSLISDVVLGLKTNQSFLALFQSVNNIYVAILFGAIASIIFQSSTITSAIVVILAGQGLLSVFIGIGIILGANIGSASTSFIASIFMNHGAKKTATAHVLYNTFGVLFILPFVDRFYSFVTMIGGSANQQVANAHLFFNLFSAIFFLIFIKSFALFVEWFSTKIYSTTPISEQKINF